MWTRYGAMEHPYGRRPCDVGGMRRTLMTVGRVYLIDLTQGTVVGTGAIRARDSSGCMPVIR